VTEDARDLGDIRDFGGVVTERFAEARYDVTPTTSRPWRDMSIPSVFVRNAHATRCRIPTAENLTHERQRLDSPVAVCA
jgi:hypothetical protein